MRKGERERTASTAAARANLKQKVDKCHSERTGTTEVVFTTSISTVVNKFSFDSNIFRVGPSYDYV